MPRIKVLLEKGESKEEAEELLYKALNSQRSSDKHDDGDFVDPAMRDLGAELENAHKNMFKEMLDEIFLFLDKEYDNL